jgi:hypothetical protein
MNGDFEALMHRLREQYWDQLENFYLPEGLAEHVAKAMDERDTAQLLFMLKLAWLFGAQAGQAASEEPDWPVPTARA